MFESFQFSFSRVVAILLLGVGCACHLSAQELNIDYTNSTGDLYDSSKLNLAQSADSSTLQQMLKTWEESEIFQLRQKDAIRQRALASGISWICSAVGKPAWVQSPKELSLVAVDVAEHECSSGDIQTQLSSVRR